MQNDKESVLLTDEQRDELLVSLANDFKRYYFNYWKYELSLQRSRANPASSECLLFNGKMRDHLFPIELRLDVIEKEITTFNETMNTLCGCIEAITDRLKEIEIRVARIESRC